jgi:hypothetical protein
MACLEARDHAAREEPPERATCRICKGRPLELMVIAGRCLDLSMIPSADALVEHLPPQGDLPDTYRQWRAEDPLSGRVKIPDSPADL